ncbi:MAG: short-chain dehydrogenase/reductase [Hyphomicrobiaceae bacterium]
MELGLRGKTAVVTGASKGIGYGVADALCREGCGVHVVARDANDLQTARDRLEDAYGSEVVAHPLDLSERGSAEALLKLTGRPDILVNNAGSIPGGALAAIDESRWREAWDLKVFGYINIARQVYAMMKGAGGGVICNITGLAADRTDFSYIAGTSGNASLNAFTRALGSYSLEDGIRVFAVSPGPVETDRLVTLLKTRAADETGSQDNWQSFLASMPLGRAAKVSEVADAVVFLVSERASYVSGTVLNVDGGLGSRGGSFSK